MKRIRNLAKISIMILTILNLAMISFCGCGCGIEGKENKDMDVDYKGPGYQVGDLSISADGTVIHVVYDNNKYRKRLREAWGFSCLLSSIKLLPFQGGLLSGL